jgi:hypothetical protein
MPAHAAARVASRAIRLAIMEGQFKSADVLARIDNPPSDRTVRRVLCQLEADNWLRRTSPESPIWRAGRQARILGDMKDSSRTKADAEGTGPGTDSTGSFGPFS